MLPSLAWTPTLCPIHPSSSSSQCQILGSYIAPNSSSNSNSDVSFRCSQASHDFKWLDPFFRHTLIFPRRKLQVYPKLSSLFSSMAQSPKPTHQLQSLVLIPSIVSPFDKSSRLKAPTITAIPLMLLSSNQFLLSLAYPVLPTLYPPSIKISDRRIQYLGHILRHPDSPESLICFNPSRTLRTISSPFRRGAPRAGLNSG